MAKPQEVKTYKVWFRGGEAQTFSAAGAKMAIEANCLLIYVGPNSYEKRILAAFSAGQWRSVQVVEPGE